MKLDPKNSLSEKFDHMPSLNFYAQECPWMKLSDSIYAQPDMYVQDVDDFNICIRLEESTKQFETAQKLGLDVRENKCLLRKLQDE